MKNLIILSIILFFNILFVNAQNELWRFQHKFLPQKQEIKKNKINEILATTYINNSEIGTDKFMFYDNGNMKTQIMNSKLSGIKEYHYYKYKNEKLINITGITDYSSYVDTQITNVKYNGNICEYYGLDNTKTYEKHYKNNVIYMETGYADTTFYDKKGRKNYTFSVPAKTKTYYKYNSNNKLNKIIITEYNDTTQIRGKVDFTYKNNILTESKKYGINIFDKEKKLKLLETNKYYFNKNNLIEKIETFNNNKLTMVIKYKYFY